MLPRDLQFELKPRRPLPWLKPGLVVASMLIAAALLAWLVPRQQRLDRLRDELDQANRQLAELRQPVPASGPTPAWQANADQDGRLFALQLEPRLLEIERCTGPKATVARIVHDELSGTTTLELSLVDAAELSTMLECFNTSDDKTHPWRLSNVEATPGAPGTPAAGQRVILKRG
jgi:hypothetical protein